MPPRIRREEPEAKPHHHCAINVAAHGVCRPSDERRRPESPAGTGTGKLAGMEPKDSKQALRRNAATPAAHRGNVSFHGIGDRDKTIAACARRAGVPYSAASARQWTRYRVGRIFRPADRRPWHAPAAGAFRRYAAGRRPGTSRARAAPGVAGRYSWNETGTRRRLV